MEKYINVKTEDDSISAASFNSINSDIDIKKKYHMDMSLAQKNTESSSESSRINFEIIEFESMKQSNKKTSCYNIDMIDNMTFNKIYEIILSSTYLIFVDNIELNKRSSSLFKCFNRKKLDINEIEFEGLLFLPYERIDIIKKNISILNNNLQKAEYENLKIYKNEEVCFGILFDEGIINKNCIYKRMEIIDMIMFIPIEKYHMKQIEYKIRGFCQIVEELGAKTINIKFKKNIMNQHIKNYDIHMNNDIMMIAGNLGFTIYDSEVNEETTNYTLTFPINNTIILNESTIKTKIKNKNFIISEASYNSNLELQYLVNSRCKHMIHKYSTIFTFNNNDMMDQKLYSNLKSHGISVGFDISYCNIKYYYMSILTDVVFFTMDDYKNIINGTNVSMDSIGFNFLIDSMKQTTDFKTNGIYKIMIFINMYIEKKIKINMNQHYKSISMVMKKIKKELTLLEYAELLCNYFSVDSHWIHFTNYIDILSNKTQTYDKLGYIIILCNNIIVDDKIEIMLRYIQQKCVEKNIEDNFWHMMQPYNLILKNELKNKLLYEYDFIHYYNWYNLNMLIRCIELYTVNFTNMDNSSLLGLIQNMNVGYKYWEFYNNVMPFIIKNANILYYTTKDELLLSNIFEKSINIDSFITSKINSISDLSNYIEKKVARIKKAYSMLNSLTFPMDLEKLCKYINSNEFIENYDYLNRKISIVIGKKNKENLYSMIGGDINRDIYHDLNYNNILDLINRIIIYNEKININKIPCDYLGFDIVYNNYINGIKKIEFEKNIKPFIINHIIDKSILKTILHELTFEKFNNISSYYNMIQFIKDITLKNNIDTRIINDYFL